MTDTLLFAVDGHVATITLNRPEKLNAATPEMSKAIVAATEECNRNADIRCVIVTGAGPKAFCAGSDVSTLDTYATPWDFRNRDDYCDAIHTLLKPSIAAVNGYALGGGCELAMMCDMIIAGDGARFGQPEVNLGILPGAGGTQRWPRTAGKYVAMEANLTGDLVDAERAYQLGIANRVVPAAETVATAQELARRIAAKPPIAVRLIKEAVNAAYETTLTAGLAGERRSFHLLFATDDQTEGMRAFLDKRPPHFKGM